MLAALTLTGQTTKPVHALTIFTHPNLAFDLGRQQECPTETQLTSNAKCMDRFMQHKLSRNDADMTKPENKARENKQMNDLPLSRTASSKFLLSIAFCTSFVCHQKSICISYQLINDTGWAD